MRVLVTQKIPDTGITMLKGNNIEVDVLGEKRSPKKKIIAALKEKPYDGMLCLLTDTIDREVLDAVGTQMAVIANYAVGYNNIDVACAKEKNIVVTNTPGVLTNTVAEHTFGLILSVATRVVEADSFTRNGKFKGWEPELFLGLDLLGKKLGIIGAGRIGARVAELAKGFGMDILYYDIHKNEALEKKTGAMMCIAPEDLLREADVVSIHLPLNEKTHHFMNIERMELLKRSAILVNAARGPIIDEGALIDVLQQKRIFGAGLDVFENEPEMSRHLRALPNVVLTPHIASASISTRNQMAKIAAQNIIAVLHGGEAPNPVT